MATQSTVLKIAIPTPLRRYFDYLPAKETDIGQLKPGVRVRVPFGRRQLIGIFIGLSSTSDVSIDKLKPIECVIDQEPVIPEDIMQL